MRRENWALKNEKHGLRILLQTREDYDVDALHPMLDDLYLEHPEEFVVSNIFKVINDEILSQLDWIHDFYIS